MAKSSSAVEAHGDSAAAARLLATAQATYAEYRKAESAARRRHRELLAALTAWAREASPHSVGEVVERRSVFAGRQIVRRWRIRALRGGLSKRGNNPCVLARCVIVRANGKDGRREKTLTLLEIEGFDR